MLFSQVKIIMWIGFVLIILSVFGIHQCNKIAKENRLIKHNTEKLETSVEDAKQNAQALINKRKLEMKQKAAEEIEKLTPEEREKRKKEALIELENDLSL